MSEDCKVCGEFKAMADEMAAHVGEQAIEIERLKKEAMDNRNEHERLKGVNRALLATKPVPYSFEGDEEEEVAPKEELELSEDQKRTLFEHSGQWHLMRLGKPPRSFYVRVGGYGFDDDDRPMIEKRADGHE